MRRMILVVASLLAVLCAGPHVLGADAPPQRPGADPRDAERVRQWGLANGWQEVLPEAPAAEAYRATPADRARGFVLFVPDRNELPPADRAPSVPQVAAGAG